jgi:hypothetical protein
MPNIQIKRIKKKKTNIDLLHNKFQTHVVKKYTKKHKIFFCQLNDRQRS